MSRYAAFLVLLLSSAAPARAGDAVPNARQAFDQVSALIRENYVDANVGDDQIWSHALEGLVERLIKSGKRPANALLSPRDLQLLRESVKGSVSGIGVVIEKVEGLVVVREVLAGGPASKTRMARNDRVLAIDGKDTSGMAMEDVVLAMRGQEGSSVELLMQRGAEEWTETVTRRRVEVESVQGVVHEGVAYVRVMSFAEDTPKRLDRVLADVKKGGAKALVLDLRGSPGGLFDAAIEVADRFLPSGQTIVTLKKRGGREEVHRAKNADAWSAPVVVLVGKHTASSAEILAAALKENRRATLVGEKTFGKGTVEKIFELENGWALKLSTARFVSPAGNDWQDKGIEPDFAIPDAEGKERGYSAVLTVDLARDPQLKAAFALLRMGR